MNMNLKGWMGRNNVKDHRFDHITGVTRLITGYTRLAANDQDDTNIRSILLSSHPFISSSQLPDSQLMKDLTSFFESFSRCLNFPLYLILPFDLVHSANCWLREEATIYLSRSDLNSLHWFLNLIFIRKTNYEFLHNHSLKVPATSITFHFASKIIYLCWNIRNQE